MGMGAFLALDGFFDRAASWLAVRARTPSRLLGGLVWGAGTMSAFVTNDAVCVLAAPLVVGWLKRYTLPRLPFLLALATAANTGSVMTLVGNPQNMLVGMLGGLKYREYAAVMLPVGVISLALNHLLLHHGFRRQLRGDLRKSEPGEPVITSHATVTLITIGATVVAYLAGAPLVWTALGGFAVLIVLHRNASMDVWARIDWSVLIFFVGLFIVVGGFVRSGLPAWAFAKWPIIDGPDGVFSTLRTAGVFLLGSNVVSNVPFILVVRDQMAHMPDSGQGWTLLAMASTFAGNLTLLGSVANIIVAQRSRELGGLGFLEYLRVGLPLAVSTTVLGAIWLHFLY